MAVIHAKLPARLLLADRADAALTPQHALIVAFGQSVLPLELVLGALLSVFLAKFGIRLELLPPLFFYLRCAFRPATTIALFLLFMIFRILGTSLSRGGEYFFQILRILGISLFVFA